MKVSQIRSEREVLDASRLVSSPFMTVPCERHPPTAASEALHRHDVGWRAPEIRRRPDDGQWRGNKRPLCRSPTVAGKIMSRCRHRPRVLISLFPPRASGSCLRRDRATASAVLSGRRPRSRSPGVAVSRKGVTILTASDRRDAVLRNALSSDAMAHFRTRSRANQSAADLSRKLTRAR